LKIEERGYMYIVDIRTMFFVSEVDDKQEEEHYDDDDDEHHQCFTLSSHLCYFKKNFTCNDEERKASC